MKPRIEDILADLISDRVGVRPKREYQFDPSRKWRFDLAFPLQKIAIEIEGRYHLSHVQHAKDCEKKNAAALAGWIVLCYPASRVTAKCRQPLIVEQIYRLLCGVSDTDLEAEVLTGERRKVA